MGLRDKLRLRLDPDTENEGGAMVEEQGGGEEDAPREMAIPETQEEIENLSEEEIMSLQEHLNDTVFSDNPEEDSGDDQPGEGGEDDTDPAASQNDQNSEENQNEQTAEAEGSGLFGLTDDILNETPTVVLEKMEQVQNQFKELGEFADPDARKGFQRLLEDEVVQERLAVLNGQKQDSVPNFDELFSDSRLSKMNIDFELNSKSGDTMRALLREAVSMGEKTARLEYEHKASVAEERRRLEEELNSVMVADPTLKSDKEFNDPSHPMRGFLEWANENRGNFNLVGIGGKRAYKMYLEEKGELTSYEERIRKETRASVQKGFQKATNTAARTLPRGNQGNNQSKQKLVHGVDPDKFRNDPNYRDRILDKHEGDLDMLHKLERLFYPQ